MSIMRYIFILFCLVLLSACNTQSTETSEEVVNEVSTSESTKTASGETILATPTAMLQELKAKVNGVESTMYTSGASFSVFEPGSVVAFLTLVNATPPKSLSTNQVGHIVLLKDGEVVMLCNVFNNGSDVYMEITDGDTKYYNTLSGQAKTMFTDIQLQAK